MKETSRRSGMRMDATLGGRMTTARGLDGSIASTLVRKEDIQWCETVVHGFQKIATRPCDGEGSPSTAIDVSFRGQEAKQGARARATRGKEGSMNVRAERCHLFAMGFKSG